MSNLKDFVGNEIEYDFAVWIYDLITGFMQDMGLDNIPKRKRFSEEGEDEESVYVAIIPSEKESKKSLRDINDKVYFDEISDRLNVYVDKPLHGSKHLYRYKDRDHPRTWLTADKELFLTLLAYNLKEIAMYGIHTMEEKILDKLKENEISIVDRYTLIPFSIKLKIIEGEGIDYTNKSVFPTFVLNAKITFDFVDEEEYLIGGTKYKEGKKRFTKKE